MNLLGLHNFEDFGGINFRQRVREKNIFTSTFFASTKEFLLKQLEENEKYLEV